jgi:hypothetical protein
VRKRSVGVFGVGGGKFALGLRFVLGFRVMRLMELREGNIANVSCWGGKPPQPGA